MKYRVKRDFSKVVMVRGSNVYVVGVKGDTVNLDPYVAGLVNHNCDYKVLVEVKAKKKAKKVAKLPVEKKAVRGNAATAQVTEAHSR